jgi:hypothetical protein
MQKELKKPKKEREALKPDIFVTLFLFVTWLAGIIIALSVGFAMIGGTLALPNWLGGSAVAMIAGWIAVITTLLSVLFTIIHACR